MCFFFQTCDSTTIIINYSNLETFIFFLKKITNHNKVLLRETINIFTDLSWHQMVHYTYTGHLSGKNDESCLIINFL